MTYYAVANGREKGIFTNWDDCNKSIKGFPCAKFKKFSSLKDAENFIGDDNKSVKKTNTLHKYFTNSPESKQKCEFVSDYFVYTDGSCINNGKNNAKAGIGIYFGENDTRNVSERITGKQTNNTAELSAIIKVYYQIETDIKNGKNITIVSDSIYAINCITTYGKTCSMKGWKDDIPNKELVKKGYEIYNNYDNVKFKHIKAHTCKTDNHSLGNEKADKLANNAIGLEHCPYDTQKIYLNVPYAKKEEVKILGGMWDKNKKKWYINSSNENKDVILDKFKSN